MSSGDGADAFRRTLGPVALAFYGIGGMLGGGIYSLVGEVGGMAGGRAWISFLIAAAAAFPTILSYAELASRHPRSGGESVFVLEGTRSEALAFLVGWCVLFSGVSSMATLSHAFAGYLPLEMPDPVAALGFLAALAAVNFAGMKMTSGANIACTAVEACGLLVVAAIGAALWLGAAPGSTPAPQTDSPADDAGILVLASGGVLAFYAFIGFEDMVNVAEEVERPRRTLPLAMIAALVTVVVVYLLVMATATRVVPAGVLAASDAPLLEVVRRGAPWIPEWSFTAVAIFAVTNTALLNGVTASRLAYGMSERGLLHASLSRLHAGRRTPYVAIVVVLAASVALALAGTLADLAATTSLLLLIVFAVCNAALLRIKLREGSSVAHTGGFRIPVAVPAVGIAASLGLAAFVDLRAVLTFAAIVAAGLAALGWRTLRSR